MTSTALPFIMIQELFDDLIIVNLNISFEKLSRNVLSGPDIQQHTITTSGLALPPLRQVRLGSYPAFIPCLHVE